MDGSNLKFGCCYHLCQIGNSKEPIFRLEEDYYSFLDLLRKYVSRIVNLYAYCLLPTHFHLLFRVKDRKDIAYVYPEAEMLGVQFKNLFKAYARHAAVSAKIPPRMIKEGFSREIPRVEDLICDLVVYIHQNPQIYGVVSDFRYWPFSSCYAYLRQDRRSMIAKELLLDSVCRTRILSLQKKPHPQVSEGGVNFDYLPRM